MSASLIERYRETECVKERASEMKKKKKIDFSNIEQTTQSIMLSIMLLISRRFNEPFSLQSVSPIQAEALHYRISY